jgi:DNA-binding transcriptional LysR family regulator
MDRLEAMAVFTRVAEMESFTDAARSLRMPKASVSLAVQRLEERLGARLLHRTTRRVRVTQDGAAFYERCKDLLADADEVESMFQATGESLAGRIRVDMPTRTARLQVIPALAKFLAEHPGIEIELGCADRPVDLVREGYDCVVRAGTTADTGLISRRIGTLQLLNLASPSYLQRHGTPRRIEDLGKHYMVGWSPVLGSAPSGWEYEEDGEWKEVPMRAMVTVNNAESYRSACLAGLGMIQSPRQTLDDDLDAGRLVEVLPRRRPQPMPLSILYPHRRQLSRRVRVFMDWLEALLRT